MDKHLDPFPHWLDDHFIDASLAGLVAAECAEVVGAPWVRYDDGRQRKWALPHWHSFGSLTWRLLDRLCRLDVWRLTGTQLCADFGLWGGGVHLLGLGDAVGLHLDADHHARTHRRRALSGCLYLSACRGGALQLWDRAAARVVKEIEPRPGRLVLFENAEHSWHSVGAVAEGMRLSLAVFWHEPRTADRLDRPRALFAAGPTPVAIAPPPG